MSEITHLRFKGIALPICLEDSPELLDAIQTTFTGWPWHQLKRHSPLPPVIRFTREGEKFHRHSRWVDKLDLDDDPADAMCNFVSDMLDCYLEEHPGMLGLHASAVKLGEGLIVFPSTHRAGKSLLTTHLISKGGVLFSDDVLLIPGRGCHGMATGVSPRLRLPVPPETDAEFKRFIKKQGMCKNERYGWIKLNPQHIAPLGEKAPITAIIMLNRQQDSPKTPQLTEAARAQALHALVSQGFMLDASASEVLKRLSYVAKQSACYTLNYHSAEEAADYLLQNFNS